MHIAKGGWYSKFKYILLGSLFLLTPFFTSWAIKDFEPFMVEKIQIDGLKKIESEAILEKIAVKKGQLATPELVDKDIRVIYEMKFFDKVEAHRVNGTNTLLFRIKERPLIKTIKFEGNSELSQSDLQEKVKSKQYTILDQNLLKSDSEALQKFYEEKGFYLASVSFETKQISKEDQENFEVTFHIKEFDKVRVKKITFLGNRELKDSELKDVMVETKEDSLFSFLSGSGNFKEFNFETDIERLKYYYKTKGYLQINVGTPQVTVSPDKRWLFISIKIQEGPQFSINRISFEGDLLFTQDDLMKKITMKEGETYSEETLRKDIQGLTESYQDEGYAFANVMRTLNIVPGENKVDVVFSFEKGKIAHFGKIIIKGNTKTRDKVIRRELMIQEGTRFSGSGIRESKENVERLGFFEPGSIVFNTVTVKDKDDVLNLEVLVKERNTGQISLGAGYSTASKGFIQASVAQKNFLGRGQELSLSLNLAKNNREISLGFTEPYLFDTKWTAGADVFYFLNRESYSYDSQILGSNLRVGHPLFDYTRLYFTYKFENTTLFNVKDPYVDPKVENGITSAVETTLVYDKRNNRFEPSEGLYGSVSYEWAGLGGAHHWARTETDGRFYHRVWQDLVFRSRLLVEKLYTQSHYPIPRTKRFYMGGPRDMRGYDFEAIGPKETIERDGKKETFNQRGLFSVLGTIEFEHPLVREAGLKWVVFMDAGNVYSKYFGYNGDYELRYDWGFGIRWFSPIGPLRFEFGHPIKPREGESERQFFFDIGQIF